MDNKDVIENKAVMDIKQYCINTIRFLSAEAVQKANSGHPGLPMGAAPMAFELWSEHLKHNPKNPDWFDRDRFILSAGHGSMLLYSLLHLFGYGLGLDEIKRFRQFGSKTPGHPEHGHTAGAEATTGPLGQGIANGVGMAMAETYLAGVFNREGYPVIDHHTYVLAGDGCMMEGIASEAASLAGSLGLGKLIVLYDSNRITIEGSTSIAFREDVAKRYEAYGWQVLEVSDGNDTAAVRKAIQEAKQEFARPSLIVVKTQIAYGSPQKQGKASAHGEPLGEQNILEAKEFLGWPWRESFYVPEEVTGHMQTLISKASEKETLWQAKMLEYQSSYPELAAELLSWIHNDYGKLGYKELTESYSAKTTSTRVASGDLLQVVMNKIPNLIGGSADLSPSTKTLMNGRGDFSLENHSGANLHFGVREHAMAAAANGMLLHGGIRPYVATFFVFSDYMKPAMRLAALMKLPVIYILTHDSIGVGEDGPTHQPVEQLAALRSIPGFTVFRPADARETAAGWIAALERQHSPTALILSRQNLPLLQDSGEMALKGAYVLVDSSRKVPDIILVASGSEVHLIVEAAKVLNERGIAARAVSMPSWEVFEEQSVEYRQSVLPGEVKLRLAVEAAVSLGWHKYVGLEGDTVTMDTFGASAPAEELFKKSGFSVEHILEKAEELIGSGNLSF